MKLKQKIYLKDFTDKNLNHDNDLVKPIITHFLNNDKYAPNPIITKSYDNYLDSFITYKQKNDNITLVKEDLSQQLYLEVNDHPFPPKKKTKFTFIDLFAGIGGFRIAMQNLGGRCIFSSEWDKESQKTYFANYGEIPFGDITKESTKSYIPNDFDVLCAGFPCQAFSIAGKRGGFEDTRGTLFYDVAEILKRKQPSAFFLENVKGLTNHDRGRTLATILNVLRNDLNYFVPEPEIINAKKFGVPQNRERIFIVGFHKRTGISDFMYPQGSDVEVKLKDILEEKEVSVKYYLSDQYLSTLILHKKRHQDKGNGFGYEILDTNSIANAIVVGGMGKERNLIIDHRLTNFTPVTKIKGKVNSAYVRRLTPREWARLQGYPDKFIIDDVSDAQAYKQFGNSVAIPAIQATASIIIKKLESVGYAKW